MMVKFEDGREVDYEAAVMLMDDEIREALHEMLPPCTPQGFFEAYCQMHARIFGSPFIV